MVKVFPD